MNKTYIKVHRDYQEFVSLVLGGAQSTKWDEVILEMAPENVFVGRNIDCNEHWLRARKHSPQEHEPFIGLEQIGMNMQNPKRGRCNVDGESLLYMCKLKNTALAEINARGEDIVSVGYFIIRKPQKIDRLNRFNLE